MIVVKVELWPSGDSSQKRELSRVYIHNDADDDSPDDVGDYNVAIMPFGETRCAWKHGNGRNKTAPAEFVGRVTGYERTKRHILQLVSDAIHAALSLGPAPQSEVRVDLEAIIRDRERTTLTERLLERLRDRG